MKLSWTTALALALAPAGFTTPLQGQTAADSAAIRATALDYIEGWYSNDASRMERALHPKLAKRMMWAGLETGSLLTTPGSLLYT